MEGVFFIHSVSSIADQITKLVVLIFSALVLQTIQRPTYIHFNIYIFNSKMVNYDSIIVMKLDMLFFKQQIQLLIYIKIAKTNKKEKTTPNASWRKMMKLLSRGSYC